MTVSDYEVVKYDSSLLDDVLRLQVHLWGDDAEVNRRYFAWKYEQNPYVQEPLIYVALHRGKAVATRGMHGALWEIGAHGERSSMVCAGDTVVAPAHRGRGLFRLIMNEALSDLRQRGHEYILNFGAGRTTRLLSLRSGWKRVAPYGTTGRYTAPWRHPSVTRLLRSLLAVKWGPARTALTWLRGRAPRGGERNSPFRLFDDAIENKGQRASQCLSFAEEPRPEDMADLAGRRRKAARIRHVCGPEYFAWRFRNPLSSYRFLYWDDGRLEGYLVLEEYSAGPATAVHLVDWEYKDEEVASEMLRAAIAAGSFPVMETWSISANDGMAGILRPRGLKAVREPDTKLHPAAGPLIIKVSEPRDSSGWHLGGLNTLDAENWEFRMVYSDAY